MKFSKLTPYLRLMRFHQPTGILLVLYPAIWGILFTYEKNHFPIKITFLIILGAIFSRSLGCIINDIIDRKLDSQVTRTKNRPLASGELSIKDILILILILSFLCAFIAIKLGKIIFYISIFAILLISIYPMMKYITYWPQAFLGITFNLSNIIGAASISGKIELRNIVTYIGCIFWTLAYDTIYGHQDKNDDIQVGAKSSSIKLAQNTKFYLIIFYFIFYLSLVSSTYLYQLPNLFSPLTIIFLIYIIWQIFPLNIDNPQNCHKKFKSNNYLGLIISLTIFVSK